MLISLVESAVGPVSTTSLVLVSMTTVLAGLWMWSQQKPANNFPPGPRGWPLIGNMLDFTSDTPSKVFQKLGDKYGDIFSIRIGRMWTVVFNSTDVIKEALLKKGVEFANRPVTYSSELLTDGGKDIAFGQYTPTWKLHRKLAHNAFRSLATGNNERFEKIVYQMIGRMDTILGKKRDESFDPKGFVSVAVYNFLAAMCFGKTYEFDDPDLQEWMQIAKDGIELANGLAADYIPILQYVPTPGAKLMKNLSKRYMTLIEKEYDEHKNNYDEKSEPKDLLELLFKTRQDMIDEGSENMDGITETHIKFIVLDIFSAGTDTTIYTMQWAIGLMAEYPEIQERVAKEVDDVIGRDRKPQMNDRGTLPYTESTLYEVLRYSSIAPLAVPHATSADVEIGGYFIPKGTTALFNLHAMHFDEKNWDDPHSFKPEHFLDECGSVRTHPNGFMPFSSGRRVCIGESVAKAELFLLFSWLFQHYTFSKPPGKENVTVINKIEAAMGNILKDFEIVVKKRF